MKYFEETILSLTPNLKYLTVKLWNNELKSMIFRNLKLSVKINSLN